MKIIESYTIGEAWKEAYSLIHEKGMRIKDGDQELLEILNLYISIKNPDDDDPSLNLVDDDMIFKVIIK